MCVQGFSAGHLNGLYADLEREGLSVSSRKLVHAVLGRALRDAERWGRVPRNVARLADPPRADTPRAEAWTASELHRFLEQVRGDRLYAMWRLGATTGMRRGELAGVTWRSLGLEGAQLEISQQLVPTRGGVSFGSFTCSSGCGVPTRVSIGMRPPQDGQVKSGLSSAGP